MFRQQLHGIRIPKAVGQLYKEGVWNLYRGLLPPLMMKTTSMAIMFGTYHQYKHVRTCIKPIIGNDYVVHLVVDNRKGKSRLIFINL